MKKIFMTALFALICLHTLHAVEFKVTYLDDSPTPKEYTLTFNTIDNAPGEVEVSTFMYNSSYPEQPAYNNIRVPEEITYEGTTYKVTVIASMSTDSSYEKDMNGLIISKNVRWIKHIGLPIKRLVIEDAPIEKIYDETSIGNIEMGEYIQCRNLVDIDFGNAIKYVGGFKECKSLASVNIPASVERIGSNAFANIPALKSITLPASIGSVGYDAFDGCANLETVTVSGVSDKVVEMESGIFKNCSSLRSVELPSVKNISYDMFRYCNSLESVKIGEKSFICNNIDGAMYGEIGDFAFENCRNLISLDIPVSYRRIGESTFRNCSSLPTISLRWDTEIAEGAFAGCTSIREYQVEGVPDEGNNGSFSAKDGILYYSSRVFEGSRLFSYPGGKEETSFTLPAGVTEIANGAFSGAKHLQDVTIPASVTKLGLNLFSDCPALKKVTLPEHLEYIPYGTFSGCSKLSEVNLPDGMVYISGSSFAGCGALKEIKLPSQLKTLGEASFLDCKSLSSIVIPEGVTEIRANTLYGCASLESVTLPAGIDTINTGAFQGCGALKSVELPASLTALSERAFKECASLESVVIPDGVKALGTSAFEACGSLKSIDTGSGLEKMNEFAFYGCGNLENIVFGSSLAKIGDSAFTGADAIKSIVCLNPTPPEYKTGFSQTVITNATVTVPEGSEDSYHNDPTWNPMVEGSTTAITDVETDDMEYTLYDLNGRCIAIGCRGEDALHILPGVYIRRYTDGSVRKIFVKP